MHISARELSESALKMISGCLGGRNNTIFNDNDNVCFFNQEKLRKCVAAHLNYHFKNVSLF